MCFKAIFQYYRGGNISPRIWDGLEPAIGYNEIMPNTNTNANGISDSLCTLSIICTIGRRWEILSGEICVFHVVGLAVG